MARHYKKTKKNCNQVCGKCKKFFTKKELETHWKNFPKCLEYATNNPLVCQQVQGPVSASKCVETTKDGGALESLENSYPTEGGPNARGEVSAPMDIDEYANEALDEFMPVHADSDDETGGDPTSENEASSRENDPNMFRVPPNFDSSYMMRAHVDAVDGLDIECRADKMSAEEKSDLELLKILKGQPLHLWKQIREWRFKSHYRYKHNMNSDDSYHRKERATVIEEIGQKYGCNGLAPKIKRVFLPKLEMEVDLVCFSFMEQMVSLLTNPEAILAENLLFDPENPFKKPVEGGDDGYYADINTGSVYCNAWEERCRFENDFLCPVITFCDKSFCDHKGKLTLEPIMFTLGCFNLSFRNRPEAWRPMGYIPNLDHLAPRARAIDKLHDYHYCVEILMSEMIAYQRLQGIDWRFPVEGGDFIDMKLHIPLLYVIGDTEGHDKMAGRKVDRASGESRQCRSCDVWHRECDNPYVYVEKTDAELVGDLRDRAVSGDVGAKKILEDLGYRAVPNAYDRVDFADNVRGIHGATPAEVLHTINLGLEDRVIVCLFLMKRVKRERGKGKEKDKAKEGKGRKGKGGNRDKDKGIDGKPKQPPKDPPTRKRVGCSSGTMDRVGTGAVVCDQREEGPAPETEEEKRAREMEQQREIWEFSVEEELPTDEVAVYEQPDVIDYSKRGIFGRDLANRLDRKCAQLHQQLRWQSDTDMPRTSFPTGVASLAKMTGAERTGVLLLVLLVICMDNVQNHARRDKNWDKKFTADQCGHICYVLGDELKRNVVKHISLLLMLEALVKSRRVKADEIDRLRFFTKTVVEGISNTFPRNTGTGHATIKTHLVSHHMIDEIARNGSLENSNSGPLESQHKESIKLPGGNTQKRAASFAAQVSYQAYLNCIIERGMKDHPSWKPHGGKEVEDKCGKPWATIYPEKIVWGPSGPKKNDITENFYFESDCGFCSSDLLEVVRSKILPAIEEDYVEVHTQATVKGISYHCHPKKGKDGLAKQHWAIGRTVIDGQNISVGHHLQCLLNIPSDPKRPIDLGYGVPIKQAGMYFLAHCLTKELKSVGYDSDWEWYHGTLCEENQLLVHVAHKMVVEAPVEEPPGKKHRSKRSKNRQQKEKRRRYAIHALRADMVIGGLIGVRDPSDGQFTDVDFYYFIESPSRWAELFVDAARDETGKEYSNYREWNREFHEHEEEVSDRHEREKAMRLAGKVYGEQDE